MRFEFATARRVLFGEGRIREAGPVAAEMGRRALVVTGKDSSRAAGLVDNLQAAGVETAPFSVSGEPSVETIDQAIEQARQEACELVVGVGGGSVIDTAKAVAVLLQNPGKALDYLEVVGKGEKLHNPSVPMIAIPTTAGTGSEVTRNAVLGVPEHQVKVSLRSPNMLPRLALVDPELTYSLPPDVTARTGMDALTQLIEAYVSNQANPITDGLCLEGIQLAAGALLRAYRDGDDHPARGDMAAASLLGGMALANAKLGAVHGFAGTLGGRYPAPHGAVCARLLPIVMEANLYALNKREPENLAIKRYRDVARILSGDDQAGPEYGAAWVQSLCETLKIQPLAAFGVDRADFQAIIEQSARSSSMRGNPIQLTPAEMEEILDQAVD